MGEIDLHFRPAVPVFDANMALGRRHDRRVLFDSVEDALREMDRAGVARALVYSTVAATDPIGGNRRLEAMLEGEPRLVPQLVGSPAWDDLQRFADGMKAGRASSMRMLPALHGYPLRPWTVGEWFEWAAAARVPVWLPVNYASPRRGAVHAYLDEFDPSALYDTLSDFPDLNVVLAEVQYPQAPWALALLRALPNLHMEISRFVSTDGVTKLLGIAGESRVLFGSRFRLAPVGAALPPAPVRPARVDPAGAMRREPGPAVGVLSSLPWREGVRGRGEHHAVRKAVKQTERARNLRREQTDAESALWGQLRNKRLHGLKFRRQQPVGSYVVDFVSLETRLVVEVDGGHHDQPDVRITDAERTVWLESNGYRVLRFWNNEVLGNLEGVLAQISETVEQGRSPSPQPSPVEGEGVRRKVGPSQSNARSPSPQPSPSRERG